MAEEREETMREEIRGCDTKKLEHDEDRPLEIATHDEQHTKCGLLVDDVHDERLEESRLFVRVRDAPSSRRSLNYILT